MKRNECFKKFINEILTKFINEKIINDGEVMRMTQIVAFYKTVLQEANFQLRGCRSDNL